MSPKITRFLVALVLVDFVGLTIWAVSVHGFVGLFEAILASPAGILAFVDLSIALSLAMIWMWQDARRRGVSPLPYCAVTLATGSVGPLLYLLLRPADRTT